MNLWNSVFLGALGSFFMFIGDMLLYYDKKDYDSNDTINSIIEIMKNVSIKRLYFGGILGPICSLIYIMGLYHIVLISQENYLRFGWIVFLVNVLGLIFGGAYHIQCAYLGLLSRHDKGESFKEFLKFLKFQTKFSFGTMALGNLGLTFIILRGYTILHCWQFLFTPIVLIMLTPTVDKLPKGYHIIIRGGWLNLIYFIYYISLMVYLFI